MPEITAILENPEAFGFTFISEIVHKMKRASTLVPLIKLQDLQKFEASFPGVILETEDGQSIRVNSQRISRDAWFSGDKDEKSLKMRLVRWLLKVEQPTREVVVEKFSVLIDGEWIQFDSKEEALAAQQELQTA